MKKSIATLLTTGALCFSLAACGGANGSAPQGSSTASASAEAASQSATSSSAETQNHAVAKDGANMQTADKSMPTRVPPENGTKINMYFGDTLITGVLNDSETAKALIAKLPMQQHVSRYSHDFCGVTEELPYKEEDVHYGWLNGDIDYARDMPYFTILFEDEDVSEHPSLVFSTTDL